MSTIVQPQPNPRLVPAKALLKAGHALGLSQERIGEIVGRDRRSISRGRDAQSKSRELA